MQRITLSLAIITILTGAVIGGTGAFFNDTETSSGNTLGAGSIDLKVDNESYYNGLFNEDTSWEQTDLTIEKFFNFLDLKPGDYGEDTISLHVETNDAYLCADVTLTSNDDNTQTEPESLVDGDGTTTGELAALVNFLWWADDGDNILEADETVISQGNLGQVGLDNTYPLTLADSDENIWTGVGGPVPGNETLYIGKAWCFGDIDAAPLAQDDGDQGRSPADDNNGNNEAGEPEDGGITCDGSFLGNESQTDSMTADVTFYAEQARHNDAFQCAEPQGPRTTLTLVKQLFSPVDDATDWVLAASGPTPLMGVTGSPTVSGAAVGPGTYDLSEIGPLTYNASNWSCVGGNQTDGDSVAIAEGDNVVCTIVNYITCEDPSLEYADFVVTYDQGVRKNGTAVALDRSDPSKVLGMPQSTGAPFDSPVVAGSFFSLGFDEGTDATPNEGGTITVEFINNFLVDGVGNDLRMWEVTGGSNYPVEKLKVEVSQDGATWFEVASSVDRDAEADLANSGLAWARFVRLTDVSDRTLFEATADAYDLDAFSALTCADRSFIIN